MNTQISTKLAALAVALMINCTMIGSIAFLFNGRLHQHPAVTGSVSAPLATSVQGTL